MVINLPIKERIRECERCPLYEITPQRPVPGVGNGSEAFFVCERLDCVQATVEIPFSGDDADYIKDIIKRAGLNYKNYYYTSLLKCADCDGIYKKKEHLNICKDWVFEEIKEKKPKYVFCMGKEVLYRLLPECKTTWKMKDIIGDKFIHDNVTYIPIYSLSYLKEYGRGKTQEIAEVISGILG